MFGGFLFLADVQNTMIVWDLRDWDAKWDQVSTSCGDEL